jgi:hypothetical protein
MESKKQVKNHKRLELHQMNREDLKGLGFNREDINGLMIGHENEESEDPTTVDPDDGPAPQGATDGG